MTNKTKKINNDGILSYLSNNTEFDDFSTMVSTLVSQFSINEEKAVSIVCDWLDNFLTTPIVSEKVGLDLLRKNLSPKNPAKFVLCPKCKAGNLRIEIDSISFFKLIQLPNGDIQALFSDSSCFDNDRLITCSNSDCGHESRDLNIINSIIFR